MLARGSLQTRLGAVALCALVWLGAAPAAAQPTPRPAGPAAAARVIALPPLTTLGDESSRAEIRKVAQDLEKAMAEPGTRVIGPDAVSDAVKKAKKPLLRECGGELACLVELGQLVGATHVVAGEVGGLGAAQVVGLRLVDVGAGKDVRNTTLEVGTDRDGGARGAVTRLLSPARYTGKLAVEVDASGASIYLSGTVLGKSPAAPIELPVGSHALRVTHPEYRDFVRFVDVTFGATTTVKVGLQQFPIVANQVNQKPRRNEIVTWVDPPWYRRWYVLVGAGVVVLGAATALAAGEDLTFDYTRPIGP
ncbi:MAG: PEGA domain-containing protein [Kofleriaceae bacterium]|nr:PEGA domain-containing protein [Kofleriaceae bacterium]